MSQTAELWRLDGTETTLLVVNDHQCPRLFWFGKTLPEEISIRQALTHDDTALPFGTLDTLTPLSLFPQASTGFTGSPSLNGHRNGCEFAHRFRTERVEQSENALSIHLHDPHTELALKIFLHLDVHSDVASLHTELTNLGTELFTVDWLASATLPLPDHYQECLTQHGRWGLENQSYRRSIAPGRLDISNLHGRTSHQHAPGLICGTSGFENDQGDVLFAQLGWSGNFSLRLEQLSDGTQFLQAGVLFLPGEARLAKGETLKTPGLYFTRARGLNQGTQRFHQYLRQRILPGWTRQPRPVHANSWEALYFRHDIKELLYLIDASAELGAERFVLDDGWFRHRRDDTAGLGDWVVDQAVYPDGLHPIVNRVRQHDMQFGLWFEPEMVNPDSDLYRAHPDWAMHVGDMTTPLARNQLVLDIARTDVSDYLYERITSLVLEYQIDYIKWDFNRDLVLAGDGRRARAAQQPLALYRLLERIQARCPSLEIESCASGGARSDLAVLQHTGRVWASDNIDPIERAGIQSGFLRFIPPEIMGAHVGHEKAHLTGRVTSLHTRAIVALQGQYGFELDARKLTEDERQILAHYTSVYKSCRDWLAESTRWQLRTASDDLLASGQIDTAKTVGLFTVITLGNLRHSRTAPLVLAGLSQDQQYRVKLFSTNLKELQAFNKIIPAWCLSPVTTHGALLMTIGLPLPVLPPQSALLIICECVSGEPSSE